MAKFIIECPHCGTYQEASTGFFSRKVLECKCGKLIDIKRDRMSVKECPHCGNTVIYDQAKGNKAVCPVCKEKLITDASKSNFVNIMCPSCSCELHTSKNAVSYTCPLCQKKINVQEEIAKKVLKEKGLASVIKYEGPNDVFVWKHPIEDFNLGSQLIVHDSQEAIFFRDGKALDCFGGGRYTLATQKLPLLDNLYKLPVDENIVFHSEVYFINLVTQVGIKWGTDTKVKMFDPTSGLHIELGAYGEFSLRVENSRKLLLKLIGTSNEFKQDDMINQNPYSTKFLTGKFKGLIISKVKTLLARVIKENNINILEVDERLDLIADNLKREINSSLSEYGLLMPEFYVLNITTPDDDPNFRRMKEQYAEQYLLIREEQIKKNVALAAQQRKIVEAQTGAQEEIIAAQARAEVYRLQAEAEAKEMQMKGYTYQDETKRQVSLAAMENLPQGGAGAGISNMIGDVVGLGVTLGAVGSVVDITKNVVAPVMNATSSNVNENLKPLSQNTWNCACGQNGISTNFCPNCGNKRPSMDNEWDCSCGQKGVKTNFCPNCGNKRP